MRTRAITAMTAFVALATVGACSKKDNNSAGDVGATSSAKTDSAAAANTMSPGTPAAGTMTHADSMRADSLRADSIKNGTKKP